jgi:HAD superfamily hydrolase (TIGR01484 family)
MLRQLYQKYLCVTYRAGSERPGCYNAAYLNSVKDPVMNDTSSIKLIIFDIDGVLTGGETKALDHELLKCLAGLNRSARQNSKLPGVTLCSGRAAPYVELMTQAIDGFLPAVFENGAGLYSPQSYSFIANPILDARSSIYLVRQRIQTELVDSRFAFFQPGKEYTLTLFPTDPANYSRLQYEVERVLGPLCEGVDLVQSPSCLNVLPRGVNKGSGVQFLASQTGIDVNCMLGVGDSDNDLPFLTLVGYNAAPANANTAVKSIVQYISPQAHVDGVRDIIAHFGIPCQ